MKCPEVARQHLMKNPGVKLPDSKQNSIYKTVLNYTSERMPGVSSHS